MQSVKQLSKYWVVPTAQRRLGRVPACCRECHGDLLDEPGDIWVADQNLVPLAESPTNPSLEIPYFMDAKGFKQYGSKFLRKRFADEPA